MTNATGWSACFNTSTTALASCAHMVKLLTELRSVLDRPDHALLLVEEVYATFDSLPAELRQKLDEKFQRMEARTLIH